MILEYYDYIGKYGIQHNSQLSAILINLSNLWDHV